jgi:RNA polymerase-binding protein DksA
MTTKSGTKSTGTARRTTTSSAADPKRASGGRTGTGRAAAAAAGAKDGSATSGSANNGSSRSTATKKPAARRSSASAADTTKPAAKPAAKRTTRKTRSAAETETIRVALNERLVELHTEYEKTMAQLTDLQRDRLTDSAGDDQADTGTKTFEREQEISLANGIRDRVTQVERALERLDDGHYGYCERCGNPIPAGRLAAFPSATLCVACKQLEERR